MSGGGRNGGRKMTTVPAEAELTLEEAARRLGVHYMTVYRYVRLGRLAATQRSGRWFVAPAALERLTPAPATPPGRRHRSWEPRQERLISRLLEGDALGCWAIVEQALTAGASPTDIYLQLLAPALRRIGERWSTGELDVGDEHRATAVALRVMGRLGPSFSRSGRRRPGAVLLGGAPGDPHLLPVAMVADVLRGLGRNVIDLGANVPQSSFLRAAARAADVVAIGVSIGADATKSAAAGTLAALRSAHPEVLLLAGGPAVHDRHEARALGADDWAADAVGVADLLEAINS